VGVSRPGLVGDVGEIVEDEERLLESLRSDGRQRRNVQQLDEGAHVVAAHHGARSSVAFSGEISGLWTSPWATAERNEAFTLAASSTPGGTRG